MAEEPTPAATETPSEPQASAAQTVPYDRFKEVNDRLKARDGEMEELRSKLEELQDRDKSELERERTARERAEKERQELLGRVTSLEKGGWVRDAAAAQNFHNPSAAASFLDLSGIEDARDAERAVKDLAKRETYLVKPAEDPKPQVGQVLKDGKAVPAAGGQTADPEAEQESQEFLKQLKEAADDGWASSAGLLER